MNAPPGGMSPEAFNAAIAQHMKEHYEPDDKGGRKCKKCGSQVQNTTCYVSFHSTLFSSCAGSGRCDQISLPYCPTCEGVPIKTSTCVHTPDA